MTNKNSQTRVVLQAFLVTFIWSTSWILIKFGLEEIPALTFAGLRYFIAFLILLPIYWRSSKTIPLKELKKSDWGWLFVLGLFMYAFAQGSQFLGLKYLPAILFSLLLNFSALLIAIFGYVFLKEKVRSTQWIGIGIFLVGILLYFYPVFIPPGLEIGFWVAGFNITVLSIAAILGRLVNRAKRLDALTVTVVSMGIGSILLLLTGIITEPWPTLSLKSWGIILILASVNTAFTFTLWNHVLRTLSAAKSGMINNTMTIQIAILAWIFLGEQPSPRQWIGMLIAMVGVYFVNKQKNLKEG